MDYAEAVMNTARQRILQRILMQGSATAAQLGEALPDIPRPSLYRHLRILLEVGAIELAGERAVRGAVEKTYRPCAPKEANVPQLIQSALMRLAAAFSAYFDGGERDPQADMLTLASATLVLDDAQFADFLQRYAALLAEFMEKEAAPGARPRSLTIISAPTLGAEEGEKA